METPEYYQYTNSPFTPEKRNSDNAKAAGGGGGDHFIIEDLLDFPNDEVAVAEVTASATALDCSINAGGSTESSSVTVVDSCNSSFTRDMGFAAADGQFSNDLCVPYDDLAELEWLSNFVEESFSSEDLQKLELISGLKARPDGAPETHHHFQPGPTRSNNNHPIFNPDMTVPGKARSKRSRAAPCNWTSRLLVLSPATTTITMSSESSESDLASSTVGKKTVKILSKKKEVYDNSTASGGDGRKCLHCATDKTPQWRTGPLGPKTLCNACGVRYKSGRLVPEYRPAASPTFVLTKHSNSHRKVLELRRQKEMQSSQPPHQQFLHQPNMMFEVVNSDDYLIHQHIGPDYRQLL